MEVSDKSLRLPDRQAWSPAVPGGFGWMLVNQIAGSMQGRTY
ncbi:hypothetical protein [Streptomyces subrutilus]